jgi:hypothetical protein
MNIVILHLNLIVVEENDTSLLPYVDFLKINVKRKSCGSLPFKRRKYKTMA